MQGKNVCEVPLVNNDDDDDNDDDNDNDGDDDGDN